MLNEVPAPQAVVSFNTHHYNSMAAPTQGTIYPFQPPGMPSAYSQWGAPLPSASYYGAQWGGQPPGMPSAYPQWCAPPPSASYYGAQWGGQPSSVTSVGAGAAAYEDGSSSSASSASAGAAAAPGHGQPPGMPSAFPQWCAPPSSASYYGAQWGDHPSTIKNNVQLLREQCICFSHI